MSIPSPDYSDPHIQQMVTAVDDIMVKTHDGKLAEAFTGDRGGVCYYCKECSFVGEYVIENEDHFVQPTCEQCKSTHTIIGTKQALIATNRIKE